MNGKKESQMNSTTFRMRVLVVLTAAVACALALRTDAQVQTQSTTTTHQPTVETTVARGEVVYVNGNELVVKMEDGTLRHFANVPDDARAIVDGKEIGIHDVKVGMKLEKTITTTSTPKTIKTVQTVTGKVWQVSPPNSVTLTLADGTNQRFNIPKDQKFNINGQMMDAWGLKKGMNVSATRVVEEPVIQVERETRLTGSMPPTPPPPPADAPILIAEAVPVPVPVQAPAELPKTGSPLSLIGFIGLLCLAASLSSTAVRKITEHHCYRG